MKDLELLGSLQCPAEDDHDHDDLDHDHDDLDHDDLDHDFPCQGMKTRVVVEPRTRRRSFLPWAARREARGGRLLSR